MTTAFPTGGRAIIDAMIAKFPHLFVNDDDIQRELTQRLNQQFQFQFGNRWGGKVRTGLDPKTKQSKDSMAVKEEDGTLTVWDMFSSAPAVIVNDGDIPPPTHANLPPSEATFVDLGARDWLGQTIPGPEPEPEPPTDDCCEELRTEVANLKARLEAQGEVINSLANVIQRAVADIADVRQHAFLDVDEPAAVGTSNYSVVHRHAGTYPLVRTKPRP